MSNARSSTTTVYVNDKKQTSDSDGKIQGPTFAVNTDKKRPLLEGIIQKGTTVSIVQKSVSVHISGPVDATLDAVIASLGRKPR